MGAPPAIEAPLPPISTQNSKEDISAFGDFVKQAPPSPKQSTPEITPEPRHLYRHLYPDKTHGAPPSKPPHVSSLGYKDPIDEAGDGHSIETAQDTILQGLPKLLEVFVPVHGCGGQSLGDPEKKRAVWGLASAEDEVLCVGPGQRQQRTSKPGSAVTPGAVAPQSTHASELRTAFGGLGWSPTTCDLPWLAGGATPAAQQVANEDEDMDLHFEAMVEELAGANSYNSRFSEEGLADVFLGASAFDAIPTATFGAVQSELRSCAPVFEPGQMWAGRGL